MPGFLRPSSRRIETRSICLGCVVLVCLIWAPISPCQEAIVSAKLAQTGVIASAELQYETVTEVIDSLSAGLKSEIIYQFRLYERTNGLLSFFGDRLVAEARPAYTAHFDVFRDVYVVGTNDGTEQLFQTEADFVRGFFHIQDVALGQSTLEDPLSHYVQVRIRLIPVKLRPPLTIIALFSAAGSIFTDWVTAPVVP